LRKPVGVSGDSQMPFSRHARLESRNGANKYIPLYHCCSSFLSKLVIFCSSLSWSSASFLDCLFGCAHMRGQRLRVPQQDTTRRRLSWRFRARQRRMLGVSGDVRDTHFERLLVLGVGRIRIELGRAAQRDSKPISRLLRECSAFRGQVRCTPVGSSAQESSPQSIRVARR
jgi:hypothetical protein